MVPVFKPCIAGDPEFASKVAQKLRRVTVPAGSVVIQKGDVGKEMYFVVSGILDVLLSLEDESTVVYTNEAGSYFGERSLINGEPRTAYVRARTQCELLVLGKVELDEVRAENRQLRDSLSPRRANTPPPKRFVPQQTGQDEIDGLSLLYNVPLFQAMPDTVPVSRGEMEKFIAGLSRL